MVVLCSEALALNPLLLACRMGFFITIAEVEPQLEVDLLEGKCALDAPDVEVTLFDFELLEDSDTIVEGYVLKDMLEVGAFVVDVYFGVKNLHSTLIPLGGCCTYFFPST
jgi:hypothetical protein